MLQVPIVKGNRYIYSEHANDIAIKCIVAKLSYDVGNYSFFIYCLSSIAINKVSLTLGNIQNL